MRAVTDSTRQKFWKPSTDSDPSDFEVSATVQRSNAMWGFSLGDRFLSNPAKPVQPLICSVDT